MAKIKAVPLELWPLGAVVGAAVGFAIFSTTKKLASDKTLRLSRNKPEDRVSH
ncbi:NADH-ubiquinone reductase complex 1 MLRQ subunit [Ascosphaera apis ARSEF 7405]|uniref:NADH-ubiquinone reductase complex 1 MLRQ subunit n=1 Tax=Ascosphaera apis ARSEF 7405 TaxID=392613 RepID=A0A167V703_9EURO|nr:NADH-ubiquinone reductase complex 1 MLRQ subunit [Ascosphaera apis ARSEF 7405]